MPTKPTILEEGETLVLAQKRYHIEAGINRGGSGEVYNLSLNGANYALKLFYPFYRTSWNASDPNMFEELLTWQMKEYQFLATMSHPNIVGVIDCGMYDLRATERRRIKNSKISRLPYIIEQFVQGKTLDAALKQTALSASRVGGILAAICRALVYIHDEKKYMHADIKASNIIVRDVDQQPILVDFALAKNFDFAQVAKNESTPLEGDWDLFPPLPAEHPLKLIKERKVGSREEIYKECFPALDLYGFGLMLKELRPTLDTIFDRRERSYLNTLIAELTNWETVRTWQTKSLEARISRLSPEQYSVFGVPELTASGSADRTIMIPPDISVPLTERLERLIGNRSFRRLAHINQLGLLSLVYPGADYKRFVHVLYSYNIARQLVTQLYTAPRFRLHFDPNNALKLFATVLGHDINHFPFLHIFQEAGIPTFERVDLVDLFCNGELTGEIALREPSFFELLNDVGVEPSQFKRLIFRPHAEQVGPVDQVISSFVNSGADVDKMSYLYLDGYFSGVRYGTAIDYAALTKAATVDQVPGSDRLHLVFTERSIQALEHMVMTRFWNFRSLYWHHTNRALMSMILSVVKSLYGERGTDIKTYLTDTLWMNDFEVIKYLDRRYVDRYRMPSGLNDLPQNRQRLFKRLYTVRAGGQSDVENNLYRTLKSLDADQEFMLRQEIAANLDALLRKKVGDIGSAEVLIDIPRREMDSGGRIYVVDPTDHRIAPLDEISRPVQTISSNYELLTKRIRFFISPRIATYLGDKEDHRDEIYELIYASLAKVAQTSQIA